MSEIEKELKAIVKNAESEANLLLDLQQEVSILEASVQASRTTDKIYYQAGPLQENIKNNNIPKRFHNIDNDVKFLASKENKINISTYLFLLGFGLFFVFSVYILVANISKVSTTIFDTIVSLGFTIISGIVAVTIALRIKHIRNLIKQGARYGIFIAPEAILIRSIDRWTYLPYNTILRAEIELKRVHGSKRMFTIQKGWVIYHGTNNEHKIMLPEIIDYPPALVVDLINQWNQKSAT